VYTQCSKCETVFKLSAEVLRAAGGQVRCGRCGEVFSALARLAEDSAAFAADESSLDLEARADSILESIAATQVAHTEEKDYEEFAPPGVEVAQLEVLDWTPEDQEQHQDTQVLGATEEAADRSLEFTLPPGELDKIFVEFKVRAPQPAPREVVDAEPELQPTKLTPPSPPSQLTQPPIPPTKLTQLAPPGPPTKLTQLTSPTPTSPPTKTQATPPTQPIPPSPPTKPTQLTPPTHLTQPPIQRPQPHPEIAALHAEPPHHRVSGFEVPEDVRRDMLAVFEQELQPASVVRHLGRDRDLKRRRFIGWLGAAIVSTLLLTAQIVHQNRDWFVVRSLYGALDAGLPPPANLSAYQLRQWGVTGDPDANGILRLRASILNAAPQLQPYPLLRVTLADRFGKSIGRRDFEPTEYLGKPTARLLAPGERVDATLQILDPGKNAEGFEIDVCLRGADQRIACQSDAAPQTQR
jgi:predicted Zn finger-like uncharacterized protein